MVGADIGESETLWMERDEAYRHRRAAIASLAAGPTATPATINYTADERRTWRVAKETLSERWTLLAAPEALRAEAALDLPETSVPQLHDVTGRLIGLSGFRFRAVPGLVDVDQFFGALANRVFLSTQYLRHHRSPLYTPEPDLIHEVLGHATLLADPDLALLHRLAGLAMQRVEGDTARQFIADVFWFSLEFGVVSSPTGPLAYGAGLLSSVGELDAFRSATFRPLDIAAMGTLPYDIDRYQPVLFEARSMAEVVEVVGGFFADVTDDTVASLRTSV